MDHKCKYLNKFYLNWVKIVISFHLRNETKSIMLTYIYLTNDTRCPIQFVDVLNNFWNYEQFSEVFFLRKLLKSTKVVMILSLIRHTFIAVGNQSQQSEHFDVNHILKSWNLLLGRLSKTEKNCILKKLVFYFKYIYFICMVKCQKSFLQNS